MPTEGVIASSGPDETLDLTGVPCPLNSSRVIIALEVMEPGETLAIVVDDGEPMVNIPITLAQEGHSVVSSRKRGDQWMLMVVRGEDL